MIDWHRFKEDLNSAIKRKYPHYDFRVDNFGNNIKVTLFRAPIHSDSGYFPFGKFYYGLQNVMSPEMFEFWRTVDEIRKRIVPQPDFRKPTIFPSLSKSYNWNYSIGSFRHEYIDSNEFRERMKEVGVSEQLKKDADYLDEDNPDVSESEEENN